VVPILRASQLDQTEVVRDYASGIGVFDGATAVGVEVDDVYPKLAPAIWCCFRQACAIGVFSHDLISYGSVAVRAGRSLVASAWSDILISGFTWMVKIP
jgi:hypothetical protein